MKKKTSSPKTAESGKLKKALSCWQLYILLEEVANAVIDTSKTAFDTHSPSKVMAQIGQYVTLGLAQGIADPSALAQAKANMLHAATSDPECLHHLLGHPFAQ